MNIFLSKGWKKASGFFQPLEKSGLALLLLLALIPSLSSAQMLESFEYGVPPPGWIKTNLLGGSGWYQLPIGVMPLPGWGNGTSSVPPAAGAGTRNAYCSWDTGGGPAEGYHNDQWLISPRLTGLTATSSLSYWLRFNFTNYPDEVRVRISTAGPAPANFTIVALTNIFAKGSWPGQFPPWNQYTINLGAFGIPAGTPIWVAIQEYVWDNTWNGAAVQLDVISSDLTAPPEPRVSSTSRTFTAYYDGSNPAAQTFSLQSVGSSGMDFSRNLTFGAGPTNWLTLGGPSAGTLAFQDSQTFTASVSVAGLDLGTYTATSVITVPGATNSPLRVSITFNVIRRPQTISFPNPGPQLTTNKVGLSGTASSGLPVTFSCYSGPGVVTGATNLTFTGTGIVKVIGWQLGNIYYDVAPTVTNSFTVTKPNAPIVFTDMSHVYDGSPHGATITTVPVGLTLDTTYNGSPSLPVAIGSYAVTSTVNDAVYGGSAVSTFTITRMVQTITFPDPGPQWTTNRVGLAATANSGLPVSFSVASGPGSIAGGTNLTFNGAGTVSVVASHAGDANWLPAAATNAITVTKATAPVTLNGLNQTYDGTPRVVTATTVPAGLTVGLTYDGSATAPTAAGSYAVTGTVNDAIYQGVEVGTLTVSKADQAITFPDLQPRLTNAVVALGANASSGLSVTEFSVVSGPGVINGTNLTFSGAGDVLVAAAQAGNGNWNPAAAVTNMIKAFAVNPLSGPAVGGNEVLITNGRIGDGTSITNVTLCGVVATILDQGTNWVSVQAGAGVPGTGDLVIQSDSELVVSNAYTYNGLGFIHDNALISSASMAGGGWHSLAMKADGSVVAWGRTNEYQCKVPAPNLGFRAVGAGNTYSLGLRNNSTIAGWGDGMAPFPPAPNTNFIGLAAGGWHALGLKADGTVTGWGYPDPWVIAPEPNTNFTAVAAGGAHSLALKTDGQLVVWGDGGSGQTNGPVPNENFVAMSGGFVHSAALRSDGSIVAWGGDFDGQSTVPLPNTNFVAVSCGFYHTLGLKSDGSIAAWGDNSYGQTAVPSPNEGFVAVAAGFFHSLGLKQDGTIVTWGDNTWGQLDVPGPNAGFGVVSRGVIPQFGSVAGGYPVAIVGSNLCDGTDVTSVTLCGVPAAIVSQSATQIVVTAGVGTPGRGDVHVFSVSAGETMKSNAFTYTSPEMSVLGTNGVALANHEPVDAAKGTDFGTWPVLGVYTSIFTIANHGAAVLSVLGVATNGSDAGFFFASDLPSSVLPGGTASFRVVYAPATLGAHSAGLSLINDSTNTPYVINLAGTAIKRDQDALSFTPVSPQAYLTTNALSASGGSGTGAVSFLVLSGPGSLIGATDLTITAGTGEVVVEATKASDDLYNAQTAAATVTVAKADQTISFPAIGNQLATNHVGVAATASSELGVTFSVLAGPAVLADGTNVTFTGRGSVSMVANQAGDENWNPAPTVTNTFAVALAFADVILGDLSQTYDGTLRLATATTDPAGLSVDITYDGSATAPTAAGSYAVTGSVNDAVYEGVQTGTLVVAKASQSIAFPIPGLMKTNDVVGLAAAASSGLPVSFDVLSGPGLLTGGTNLSFTDAGVVRVVASQPGDANWLAAASVTRLFRAGGSLLWTDYDGDQVSDLAVYDAAIDASWYIRKVNGDVLCWATNFGTAQMLPVPGDYDGDGAADLTACDGQSGNWYARTLAGVNLMSGTNWWIAGGVPVAGDYDGDGIFDLALYDEAHGNWFARTVAGQVLMVASNWGYPGAVAVPGDYDGDGVSDLAVYDDMSGNWFVRTVAGGILAMGTNWGYPGARPVPGDYDGDGVFDLAVYDQERGDWYVRSLSGPILLWSENWGFRGAVPVPGDYDGDGLADMAVYGMDGLAIPAGLVGNWFIRKLDGDIILMNENWGYPNTVPVNGE